jgi:hypothetical protein
MTNFFLREQNYGILSRVINFILIFCQKNFILITTSIVVRNIIFVFNLYVEKFQQPTLKKILALPLAPGTLVKELKEEIFVLKRTLYSLLRS